MQLLKHKNWECKEEFHLNKILAVFHAYESLALRMNCISPLPFLQLLLPLHLKNISVGSSRITGFVNVD